MKYSPLDYAHMLYRTKDVDALMETLGRHWVLEWLPQIAKHVEAIQWREEHILRLVVTSRYFLQEKTKERIQECISQYMPERKAHVVYVIDRNVIGGFLVESDEFMVNGSMKGMLADLMVRFHS